MEKYKRLITKCAREGDHKQASDIFLRLCRERIPIESATIYTVLNSCASLGDLQRGIQVHGLLTDSGSVRIATALIRMYGKCGSLRHAKQTFDGIRRKDIVSWTALITACAQNGQGREAIDFYNELKSHGLKPDAFTFCSALDACSSARNLRQGEAIHDEIRNTHMVTNPVVSNALVNMYAKCGRLVDARRIFDAMQERNTISWNTMIAAYAQNGHPLDALKLYQEMDSKPTSVSFVNALVACSALGDLEQGRSIHERTRALGFDSNALLLSALIDMYTKCGQLETAEQVFDKKRLRSVHVYTSMISAYTKRGYAEKALGLYKEMLTRDIKPDTVTVVAVLNACAVLRSLEEGRRIHELIDPKVLEENEFVGNSLINLYGKCGLLAESRKVFECMKRKDIISWNSMICAYAHQGMPQTAIQLYRRMQHVDVKPNEITYHAVVGACKELDLGREIHRQISSSPLTDWLAASLVEMYSRCGRLDEARRVVEGNYPKAWTTMLLAYAQNGESRLAFDSFQEMELQGVKVDGVTYLGLLTACSHAGLVEKGCNYLASMVEEWGIVPVGEHYSCVVDILARAGWLSEAKKLIECLRFEPDEETYMALLGACRTHEDMELGIQVATCVLDINPTHFGAYSLLHNMYTG